MIIKTIAVGHSVIFIDSDPTKPPICKSQWELASDRQFMSSERYSIEDWADAMQRCDGRGTYASEGTLIYTRRRWEDMTPQQQLSSVRDLVYNREVESALKTTADYLN